MIGFILSPIGRYVVMAGVALALMFVAIKVIEQRGADRIEAKIERANKSARDKADAAGHTASTCPPDLWSREKQICETKLH
jgi:cytosine/adenosine deaminase-related metal-dependent hydrolase